MLVTTLGYDDYRGVTAVGRVFAGRIKAGQKLVRIKADGENLPESVRYLYTFQGLNKVEVEEASAGEIISLAGLEGIAIGETSCGSDQPDPTAYHQSGGTDGAYDVRRQHVAVLRQRKGKWSTST